MLSYQDDAGLNSTDASSTTAGVSQLGGGSRSCATGQAFHALADSPIPRSVARTSSSR